MKMRLFIIILLNYFSTIHSFIRPSFTIKEHTHKISSIAISNDSKLCVTGSWDATACVWNTSHNKLIHRLKGHTYFITAVAISSNNEFIATASADSTVIIWDTKTGAKKHILKGHYDFISSLAISHDDNFLLTGSYDKTAIIWDIHTGTRKHKLKGHKEAITRIAISNNNNFIVTASTTETIIWNRKDGNNLYTLPISSIHKLGIGALAISADSSFIAISSWDKSISIWNSYTGTLKYHLVGHTYPVTSLAISSDNRFIVAGDANSILLWESATGKFIRPLNDHHVPISFVHSVLISKDNLFVIAASFDAVRLYSIEGKLIDRFAYNNPDISKYKDSPSSVALSYNNHIIVTGLYNGQMLIHHFI